MRLVALGSFVCFLGGCALGGPSEPADLDDAGARADAGSAQPADDGGNARLTDGGNTADGGARVDGGSSADGGPRVDGGSSADGGPRADGGSSADGGPRADGGSGADGGPRADGGLPSLVDAGLTGEPDAAVLVYAQIPTTMQCGRAVNAMVRMQNVGTSTWRNVPEGDLGHKLGHVEPHAPFFLRGNLRFYLGAHVQVPPGAAYTFGFTLTAPREAGTYRLKVQMVHELVRWFGPLIERDIEVQTDACLPELIEDCPLTSSTFGRDVETAIDWLQTAEPQIFDFSMPMGGGSYPLFDEIGFTYGVTNRLNAVGLTAIVDGWAGDEISVKRDDGYSENFDIVRAGNDAYPGGFVRRGPGAYRATCRPAAF